MRISISTGFSKLGGTGIGIGKPRGIPVVIDNNVVISDVTNGLFIFVFQGATGPFRVGICFSDYHNF